MTLPVAILATLGAGCALLMAGRGMIVGRLSGMPVPALGRPPQNGWGTFTDGHGTYEGEFRNGKRHGHGTLTRPSGTRYTGEWKDGARHGHGTFIWSDGAW
jgi:hypothetical protein